MTYTRSPTLMSGTPSPTATTTPAASEPGVYGSGGSERVLPAANVCVDGIDAGGLDINHHLSRVCRSVWHLFQFHDRRIAELMYANRFHSATV